MLKLTRRSFHKWALRGISALALRPFMHTETAMADSEEIDKISKSDAEWKNELTPAQYDVLRQEGTDRAFSHPLNEEKHSGMFACAGCALPLFPSKFKYDSGTGWPSFFDVIPGHVETKTDHKIIAARTEYHCARCGGHQGHRFDDGPQPTGLRYCNNGSALKFIPGKQ